MRLQIYWPLKSQLQSDYRNDLTYLNMIDRWKKAVTYRTKIKLRLLFSHKKRKKENFVMRLVLISFSAFNFKAIFYDNCKLETLNH